MIEFIKCPVCKKEVSRLTAKGYCGDCDPGDLYPTEMAKKIKAKNEKKQSEACEVEEVVIQNPAYFQN